MSNASEGQSFNNINFLTHPLTLKEYEACTFNNCNFARADLSNFRFVECSFSDCHVSNAKLGATTLNDVRFINCKLLGLHFEDCSEFLFSVAFENSSLNFSSFYGRQLKKTIFKNTLLQEV